MYIHDISKDTLTTEVYPGDPKTVVTPLRSMDDEECNLSQISMCVHAGTHIDAPLHFCPDGKGITVIAFGCVPSYFLLGCFFAAYYSYTL